MTLLECKELAESYGYSSSTFTLCGNKGRIKCRWLDVYLGLFKEINSEGFMMARDLYFRPDIWVEDFEYKET